MFEFLFGEKRITITQQKGNKLFKVTFIGYSEREAKIKFNELLKDEKL